MFVGGAHLEGGVQVHVAHAQVAVEDGRRQRVQEGHARHHVLEDERGERGWVIMEKISNQISYVIT